MEDVASEDSGNRKIKVSRTEDTVTLNIEATPISLPREISGRYETENYDKTLNSEWFLSHQHRLDISSTGNFSLIYTVERKPVRDKMYSAVPVDDSVVNGTWEKSGDTITLFWEAKKVVSTYTKIEDMSERKSWGRGAYGAIDKGWFMRRSGESHSKLDYYDKYQYIAVKTYSSKDLQKVYKHEMGNDLWQKWVAYDHAIASGKGLTQENRREVIEKRHLVLQWETAGDLVGLDNDNRILRFSKM